MSNQFAMLELERIDAENAQLKSDLQAARAEVERLKAQDLTHAVLASDIKLREERDALVAKLKGVREVLEFLRDNRVSDSHVTIITAKALAEIGDNK